jgi:AraC-like DNA-binding protein
MALCNGRALMWPRWASRQSGRKSRGDLIRVKEKPDMAPNSFAAAAFQRLRPDSDRAVRLMRPAVLIGWSVAEMAAQFALSRSTIKRRLKRHGLRAPEAPDERDRRMTDELNCNLAEALLRGDDGAAKEFAALLQKLSPGSRPKAAPAETSKEENNPHTDEQHDAFMAKLESLAAPEFELAARDHDGNPLEGWGEPERMDKRLARRHPLLLNARPMQRPPPGLTRTWLLSGGRGADLCGCARSDDRAAERPDLVGDARGRPAGLAALAPPA